MILTASPYRKDKNLGKAYNNFFKLLGPDDWGCLVDGDVCFVTPSWGSIIEGYVERYSSAGLFTCWTNRVHASQRIQLLGGKQSDNWDIISHREKALTLENQLWRVTELHSVISGMVMVISKRVWEEVGGFTERRRCLGVDNDFSMRLFNSGYKILRMDGLYVFHLYRPKNVLDKSHLL